MTRFLLEFPLSLLFAAPRGAGSTGFTQPSLTSVLTQRDHPLAPRPLHSASPTALDAPARRRADSESAAVK